MLIFPLSLASHKLAMVKLNLLSILLQSHKCLSQEPILSSPLVLKIVLKFGKSINLSILKSTPLIILMLRLEVGEGERYVFYLQRNTLLLLLYPIAPYGARPLYCPNIFTRGLAFVLFKLLFKYIEDKKILRTSSTPFLGMPLYKTRNFCEIFLLAFFNRLLVSVEGL